MIVGITGKAGAGKDTLADFFAQKHGFVKVAIADPLKRICQDLFQFTDAQLWGPSALRNEPDPRYVRVPASAEPCASSECGIYFSPPVYLTPRHALQQLGTEGARNCYENVWIDYALGTAQKVLSRQGWGYGQRSGIFAYSNDDPLPPGVVLPDVRFENELRAIRAAGGHVVRVVREGAGLEGGAGAHRSEVEQDSFPEDLISLTLGNEEGAPEIMGDSIGHWLASLGIGGYKK